MQPSAETKAPRSPLMRVLRNRWLIAGVAAVVVYTLVGFFLVPFLSRYYLERFASEKLNRELTIQKVRFNPYTYRFEINGLELKDVDGSSMLAFDGFLVDFELSSVFKRAWTFAEIRLDRLMLDGVIGQDGRLNLAKLADSFSRDKAAAESEPEPEPGGLPRAILEKVSLVEATVHFADQRGKEPADIQITPLNIELTDIKTLPEHKGPYTIMARTPGGASLSWEGEVSLHPVSSSGSLSLDDLSLAKLWRFLREHVALEEPKGALHLHTHYRFDLSGGSPVIHLDALGLQVNDIDLRRRGDSESLLSLAKIEVADGSLDLERHAVHLGRFSVADGRVRAAMDEDGNVDWARLVPADRKDGDGEGLHENPPSEPSTPWKIDLDRFELSGLAIELSDESRAMPLDAGARSLRFGFGASIEAGGGVLQAVLQDAALELAGLRCSFQGEDGPELELGEIKVGGGHFDLAERAVTIEEVVLQDGASGVILEKEGGVNWARAAASRKAAVEETDPSHAADKGDTAAPSWSLMVKSLKLLGFDVDVQDKTLPAPARLGLSGIDLRLEDVSNDDAVPIRFELGADVATGGRLAARGELFAASGSVTSDLEVAELALTLFQPYVERVLRARVSSGMAGVKGSLKYGVKGADAKLAFKGGAEVSNFLLEDPAAKERLFAWEGLRVSGIDLTLEPGRLAVKEVSLLNPTGKFVIHEDKSTNLSALRARAEGASEAGAPAPQGPGGGEGFQFQVDRVRLQGATLAFADLSLKPQFSALMHELDGVVTGISSARESEADIELAGRVDEYGTVKIGGTIMPSSPKTSTHVTLDFKNVSMSNLTPYSATFAGYRIQSGKLSLDLEYAIEDSQLMGENQVVIDQLTLGGRVEDSEAPSLPLELAIALLKDSRGRIDLGLPVRGNLDDPEFKYGSLIWKALVNVITKAATAPFRILGNLIGAKEEDLDKVLFAAGSSTVPPPELEKLVHLAEALAKRPQLALEIQGAYDPAVDGRAIKEAMLRREMAAESGIVLKPGEEPGPVVFHEREVQGALERRFLLHHTKEELRRLEEAFEEGLKRAAEEGKPSEKRASREVSWAPFYKTLYEKILDAMELGPQALTTLAEIRASAVKAAIVADGGAEASRVSILDVVSVESPDGKTVPAKLAVTVAK
ncbi:DUF748 domain-containing protein [Desulfatiglans anilini]|uniref:DUF748 domain-containing protein n=1 Tax=Desulfatiglans anilini TaxID=90728 RepID=UPI0003FB74E8|nr:DUF748 domain-containing protein [Desulfatiglans anilini]